MEIPHSVAWGLPFSGTTENKTKLLKFKDAHRGRRCFIVANGPSLKFTDLSMLKDEITFGVNRIYLLGRSGGFRPTYLAVIDEDCHLRQFTSEYNEVDIPSFYNWNCRRLFDKRPERAYIKQILSIPKFSTDILKGIWTGHSVTFVCLQLAYYMGFNEVYLVGKDHDYSFPSGRKPIELVRSNGKEGNHFTDGYYVKDMVWRIPDPTGEEYAYRLAKIAFERSGRRVYDATINGKLDVFEKVKYSDLFRVPTTSETHA